jgi:trans-2,3-dihydro-3-hydroxyanthranilate isomerase
MPQLIKRAKAGILLFCPQTYSKTNKLNVRVFVDAFGIPEDPATGSGNGCLAAYLSKYQYFGNSDLEISVEQGYEINRPSILYLKTKANKETILIQVGGQVRLVAKGELLER